MGCKSMFLILPQIWDGKVLGRKPAELSIPLSCFEGTGCTVLKFEFGIGSGTAKNIYNFIYIYIYSLHYITLMSIEVVDAHRGFETNISILALFVCVLLRNVARVCG